MRLSICIATYNRAAYIGETLASIIPQLTDDVEIVILDGASPDDTAAAVARAADGHSGVRYVRAETNSGVDRDFDLAVTSASGRHCWLFADDDLIAPGAVRKVLDELGASDPDVLVVDAEVRDRDLCRVLEAGRMTFAGRRTYGPGDGDALLTDTGNALSFIGCAIVRRSWWLDRERAEYFGSLFVHVGVIFQQPRWSRAVAIAEPLVVIRLGNAMWTGRSFEIWMFMWPGLIWCLDGYSDAAKRAVTAREPWRGAGKLLLARASGGLGKNEYRRFIVGRVAGMPRLVASLLMSIPASVTTIAAVGLLGLRGGGKGPGMYNVVATSPHAGRLSRWLARRFGQSSLLGPVQ